MTTKPHWYQIAEGDLGLHESRDTDRIRALGIEVGMAKTWSPRQTPWCDIWVDSVMVRAGLDYTPTKLARSWLKWTGGELITDPELLRIGDIVVLSRRQLHLAGPCRLLCRAQARPAAAARRQPEQRGQCLGLCRVPVSGRTPAGGPGR